jgi:hypothetical protein
MIRYKDPATPADVIAAFNDLITACGALFITSAFVGGRHAADGSNVSVPLAGAWPTTWGSGSALDFHNGMYYDFVGRSLDGRKCRLALFGAQAVEVGGDYRTTTGESSLINDAVDVLNGTPNIFISINKFQPVWAPYANMGTNAYWRNKIR